MDQKQAEKAAELVSRIESATREIASHNKVISNMPTEAVIVIDFIDRGYGMNGDLRAKVDRETASQIYNLIYSNEIAEQHRIRDIAKRDLAAM